MQPSALNTMAGKLSNLGSKLDSAGSGLGGHHPGGGAFGKVGEALSGHLGDALGTAKQHVGKVAEGARGAERKLKATMEHMASNEANISKRFNSIGDGAAAPKPHGSHGAPHAGPSRGGAHPHRSPNPPGGSSGAGGSRRPPKTAAEQRANFKAKIAEIRQLLGGPHTPGKLDPPPSGHANGHFPGEHSSVSVSSMHSNPDHPNINLLLHRPDGYITGFTRPNPNNPSETQVFHYPNANVNNALPSGHQPPHVLTGPQVGPNYNQSGGIEAQQLGQGAVDNALNNLAYGNSNKPMSHALHTMAVNTIEPARFHSVYNQAHSLYQSNNYNPTGWLNTKYNVPETMGSNILSWDGQSQNWGSMNSLAPDLALHHG